MVENCQVLSKGINDNVSLVQSNDSEESSDDCKFKNSSNGINEQFKKTKIIIAGDSLLNGINEKGLSKNHSIKVNNIPGGTSDTILDRWFDTPCRYEDITKGKNLLNNDKKLKASEEY